MTRFARINLAISAAAWIIAGALARLATWMRDGRDADTFEIFLIVSGFVAFVISIITLFRGLESVGLRR